MKIKRTASMLALPLSAIVFLAPAGNANNAILLAAQMPEPPAASASSTDAAMALANVSDQLNILEKFLLDNNYSSEAHWQRLDRLEMTVFHKHNEGTSTDRVKNIVAALPEQSRTQVKDAIAKLVMSEPTANPLAPAQTETPGQAPSAPPATALAHTVILAPPAAGSAPPASAAVLPATEFNPTRLSALEQFFFEANYPNQTTEQRLARLETLIFGGQNSGTDAQRFKSLTAALPKATRDRVKQMMESAANAPAGTPVTVVNLSTPATQIAAAQAATTAPAQPSSTNAQPTKAELEAAVNPVYSALKSLVEKFYPQAKVTITGTKMHFEYKCSEEMAFYSNRKVYAPNEEGILCDITLEAGKYNKPDAKLLPSDVPEGFHTNLKMAPYANALNEHLMTRLSYPPQTDLGFKGRFERIINGFGGEERDAQTAAEEAQRVARAQHNAAHEEAIKQETQKASLKSEVTYNSAFGAANMSEQRFPNGQFRVMFPDESSTSYGTQAGLAMTSYKAEEVGGEMKVSFLPLPSLPASGTQTNAFLDKLMNALVSSIKGSNISQGFSSLKGSPGRQIVVGSIAGKPDSGALLRIYIADVSDYNYGTDVNGTMSSSAAVPKFMVYELSAVGQRDWISTPAVSNFLDSFEFFGGVKSWTNNDGLVHWQGTDGSDHWRDRGGKEHMWNARHQDVNLGFANWGKTVTPR
jgi:hypothetical protein